MSVFIYKVRLITNMHAGSGDADIGIVDNLVQRDVVTDFPTVNSSGVKGALKEHCNRAGMENKDIKYIFGDSIGGSSFEGNYKFFALNLAAVPVRSNARPYYLAVSKQSLEDMIAFAKQFKKKFVNSLNLERISIQEKGKAFVKKTAEKYERIEGLDAVGNENIFDEIKELLSTEKDIALLENNDFLERMRELPVIPRNHLDNGISKNLWYEQVVPKESIFYTAIVSDDESNKLEAALKEFVQIGANATIGYGITLFTEMEVQDE